MSEQLALDFNAPTYTSHCFFHCGVAVSTGDPDSTHEQMEAHYRDRHQADIDHVLAVDPPSPSDPPVRRRRRR